MSKVIVTREPVRHHPRRAFLSGVASICAVIVAFAACGLAVTLMEPDTYLGAIASFVLCFPILLAHRAAHRWLAYPSQSEPAGAKTLGQAFSLAAVLLLVPLTAPISDANAQESPLKVGDITITDGVIDTGDMTVGNGCVKFKDGETIGECDDTDPGETGAEPPGKTLEDALEECDKPAAEQTAAEAETTQPASEECDQLESALPPSDAGNAPESTEEATGQQTTSEEPSSEEPSSEEPSAYDEYLASNDDEACVLPDDVDDLRRVDVKRVVDGDTFEISPKIDETDIVRTIGIDTPETVDPNQDPEPYGAEASTYARDRLEETEIFLEVGEEPTDDYGRLLAHAWTPDATLFSEEMLAGGYATLLTIEPNDKYADCLANAENYAKEAGLGLWKAEGADPEPESKPVSRSGEESPEPEPQPKQELEPTLEPDLEATEAESPESTVEPQAAEPEAAEPETTKPEATETGPETTVSDFAGAEEPKPEPETTDEQYADDQEPTPEPEPTTDQSGFGLQDVVEPEAVEPEAVEPEVTSALPIIETSEGPKPALPDTAGFVSLSYIFYYLAFVGFNVGMIAFLYIRERAREEEEHAVGPGRPKKREI